RARGHNGLVATMRGFILQASYRVRSAAGAPRLPVVHLYGRLENGATFLVRDHRRRPHFYIRAADARRARALRLPEPVPVDKRNFAGEPVCRVEASVPTDVPALRERLHGAGIATYEADVRYAVRYLIEHGIKGGCEIEGEAVAGEGVDWVIDDPALRPAQV